MGQISKVWNNLYVVGVDMDNRSPEDIAREAAQLIGKLTDKLIAEQAAAKQGKTKDEKQN